MAASYENRAACYFSLHKYKEAFEDAEKSVLYDPKFVKVSSYYFILVFFFCIITEDS